MPASTLVQGTPAEHADRLKLLYGEPPGQFLQCQDGITHFVLSETPAGGPRRVAVLSHGIGTSASVYTGFVKELLNVGFHVLRYDFYGHGWSYASEGATYDLGMLLRQLQELLTHVLRPGEPVGLFVGHSTGGLLGVKAAEELPRHTPGRHIESLALISPAFWKQAPMMVKVADRLPTLMRWLAGFEALKLIDNGYLENCDNAFGHVGKEYFYPKEHAACREEIKRMFSLHPQVRAAIAGIITGVLRTDLLQAELPVFQSLVASQRSPKTRVGLFWGSHDIVVEFAHSKDVMSWPGGDSVSFVELSRMGHESPQEDPERVAAEIARWAGPPRSAL